jgi:hypothetical protein
MSHFRVKKAVLGPIWGSFFMASQTISIGCLGLTRIKDQIKPDHCTRKNKEEIEKQLRGNIMAYIHSSVCRLEKFFIKKFVGMKLIQHVLFATLIFSFIPLQAAQLGQPTNELSPSELKGLALVISAESPQYSSLKVEAVFSEPSIKNAIGYRVYYSKANGYALYVRDMMDGTTIFLLAEKKALLFDPSKEELILFQNIGLMFELGMEGNKLRFVSAFRAKKEGFQTKIVNTVKLDLVPIFKKIVVNLRGEKIKEGRYILSGETELGSVCVTEIDPSAVIPFLRIGFYKKGEPRPLLNFCRLEANKGIDNSVFRFPMRDLMDRGLVIKTAPVDQAHFIDLMSLMGRVLFVRSALAFPETRKDLVQLGINDSDWPVIEKRDKRISQALKEVFGAR